MPVVLVFVFITTTSDLAVRAVKQQGPVMRDAILKYLKQQGNASFAAMERDIPGFEGEYMLYLDHDQTLVLWPRLSLAASDAIRALLRDRLVWIEPVEDWVAHGFELVKVQVTQDLPVSTPGREVSWLPAIVHFGSRP